MSSSTLVQQPQKKALHTAWYIMGYFPWLWLLLVLIYNIGKIIQPNYYLPQNAIEPTNLTIFLSHLDDALVLGLLLLYLSIPVWALLGILIKQTPKNDISKRDVFIPILGVFLWAIYLFKPLLF